MDRIRHDGIITEIHKGGHFIVELPEIDHKVEARLSGKMRIHRIHLCIGDVVTVELSPYDLTKGRITYRLKKENTHVVPKT